MKYKLFILKKAQKELLKILGKDFEQIKKAIYNLADNPRPYISKKLIGREGWRIRIGKFRVIYEIDDKHKTVTILHIAHRKDIYKI